MNFLSAIILGVVQGLTEFLPISSSGHLLLLQQIFGWQMVDNLTFDVFLHWGTMIALVIFFFKDIIRYLKAFLKSIFSWQVKIDNDQKIAWLIIISMIPAVIIGYFFDNIIQSIFYNILSVAILLIVVAILFLLAEKYCKKVMDETSLSRIGALILGLAQAIALIPGVSRSGITIVTGLGLNLKREAAARFTFLMSIPIVFAAGCKKILDINQFDFTLNDLLIYLIGFIAAALTGYLTVKFLLNYLKNNSLNIFAYYRLALGLIIIIYLLIK